MLGGLALVLILLGSRLEFMGPLRTQLSAIATPFYWLADIPSRLSGEFSELVTSRSKLIEENKALRAESLILNAKLQKHIELRAENVRLRELMNSAERVTDTVVVAEVVAVASDPSRHMLMVDKGSEDKAFVGQPVIDAKGLLGQIVEVGLHHSRVLLITDSAHAIPVRISRNGLRAIAEGSGLIDELSVSPVAATTDIQVGDLLVSSGLGGRFPAGYPVGEVTKVAIDPGKPFAEVRAKPLAELDRSRNVLLVFSDRPAAE